MSRAVRLLFVASVLTACQTAGAVGGSPRPLATTEPTTSPMAVPDATPAPTLPPTPTPSPTAPPVPTPTVPPVAAYAFNLFTDGDFAPQHTFEWCVGASIQMAHNLAGATLRSSYDDQEALWALARDRSSNSFGGANPRGWAAALNEIGIGPYELVSVPDYDEALRTAASAIRDTGRSVGLVMWRGRHAWVMSGFESIGDPALHADFVVTGVRVLDPLYPHGSGAWGPSPAPNALLTPGELATQFVIREPRRWSSGLAAGYLLVLPTPEL